MISSLLVLSMLAAPAIDRDAADASQPQAALATAIPAALALIESKQYEKFIRKYALPSQLKKALKQKTLEEIVRSFAKDHAARIMLILKQIQDKQPNINSAGTVAEYPTDVKNFSRKKVVFEKIGGLWYLQN